MWNAWYLRPASNLSRFWARYWSTSTSVTVDRRHDAATADLLGEELLAHVATQGLPGHSLRLELHLELARGRRRCASRCRRGPRAARRPSPRPCRAWLPGPASRSSTSRFSIVRSSSAPSGAFRPSRRERTIASWSSDIMMTSSLTTATTRSISGLPVAESAAPRRRAPGRRRCPRARAGAAPPASCRRRARPPPRAPRARVAPCSSACLRRSSELREEPGEGLEGLRPGPSRRPWPRARTPARSGAGARGAAAGRRSAGAAPACSART